MAEVALAGLLWAASPIVNKLLADASAYLGVDMAREIEELFCTSAAVRAGDRSGREEPPQGQAGEMAPEAQSCFVRRRDEHEYDLLKMKAKKNKGTSPTGASSSSSVLKPLRAASSRLSNLRSDNRKLLRKTNELKSIQAEAKTVREMLGIPAGSDGTVTVAAKVVPPAKTASLPTSKVFGRDTDRDRIIDLLTKNTAPEGSSASYSGLAILGHGGAGKSTLAQYVYNDKRVDR